jgi:hypothetical protein
MTELNCWKTSIYSENKERLYYVNSESNISQWGMPTKEILPAGWEYYESRDGNKPFYFNVFEKYAQWDKPTENEKRPVPNGWVEMRSTKCNNVYYKNSSTNQTQWTYPEIEQSSTRGMIDEESEEEFPFQPPQSGKKPSVVEYVARKSARAQLAKDERNSSSLIQAAIRRKFAENTYDDKLKAANTLEAALRRGNAQKDYDDKLKASKTLEAAIRRKFAENTYDDKLKAARTLEAALRRGNATKAHTDKQKVARTIQTAFRRGNAEHDKLMNEHEKQEKYKRIYSDLKKSNRHDDFVRIIQGVVRRKLAEPKKFVDDDDEDEEFLSGEDDDDEEFLSGEDENDEEFLSCEDDEEKEEEEETGYDYKEYGTGKDTVHLYDDL